MVVDHDTYIIIMQDCIREFIDHHPEFEGMKITQSFILRKLAAFYLK